MFFRVNPNSKVGKRILRARLVFAIDYGKITSEEFIRLCKVSKEMFDRASALYDMARLARETGKPFRFIWFHLCGKLVFYRGNRAHGRAMKFDNRAHRSFEKAKRFRELLGHGDK